MSALADSAAVSMTDARTPPRGEPPRPACEAAPLSDEALEVTWLTLQERRFAALHTAFARQGGSAPADTVCGLLRGHWDQPLSRVARWIACREVVSVTWRSQVWLPMFQFERPSLDVVPVVNDVVRVLRGVYDEWELAEWFVRPHDLLGGHAPVRLLGCDAFAIKEAARLDHFINRW